jgi:hypothetical protein
MVLTARSETIWVDPAPDGGDSGPAVRDAIGRANVAGPGTELHFRAGQYRVSSAADANWFFVLSGADLTIRGEPGQTEIIFLDPSKGGFLVPHATRLAFRDLIVDYDPPPFTQGTIVAVDAQAGSFELKLDDGFPSLAEPWFQISPNVDNMAMAIESGTRFIKRGAPDHFFVHQYKQKEGNIWTIPLTDAQKTNVSYLAPGDRFVIFARRGNGAFRFSDGVDCRMENIMVHASPTLTVALIGMTNMVVSNLRVTFRDGSDRLIASDGDGFHVQQNRGGPLIENCLIEGLCDDSVNIYAPPLVVRKVISPTQVKVTRSASVRTGDAVQVFDPRAGIIRGEPVVTDIAETGDRLTLTFDRAVEPISAGEDHRTADTIYNLTASGSGYIIRNNHFRNHRRHGVLLRAGDGTIENNTFENLGGFGVAIGNEPTWPEGPVPSNVTIRSNRFIGSARSAGYGGSEWTAGISIFAMGLGGPPVVPLAHDFRIENNTFTQITGAGIALGSVRDVVLKNNLTDGHPAEIRTLHVKDVQTEP